MTLDLSRDVAIRWSDPDPKHTPLLKECGANTVILEAQSPAFAAACQSVGLRTALASEIQLLGLEEMGHASPAKPAVLSAGLWPGVSRGPFAGRGDDTTAGATRQPWIDANGSRVGCLRVLFPGRPAVLGYLPDSKAGLSPGRSVPFDTLELALAEAWVWGGNYLLAVEAGYRKALLAGDERALAAWRRLGTTTRWLVENASLFRRPVLPAVTLLVEPGEATLEIANLMYRQNVSPALASAASLPEPDPRRLLVLVAVSIKTPEAASAKRMLAHAETGATLVVDAPADGAWWRVPGLKPLRNQQDRDFYTLGRGQVVAYKELIADPNEFAFDVIDFVTHPRRAARLWNAPSVIALATDAPAAGPARGGRLLHVVNYGSPIDSDVEARVQGVFAKATLLRPDGAPMPLKTAKRGTTTEVFLPELRRVGAVVFS